jgi:sulfonate transport system substrate-binding protein
MQLLNKTIESLGRKQKTGCHLLLAMGYSLVLSTTLFGCSTQSKTNSESSTETPNATTNSTATETKLIRVVRSKQLTGLAALENKGDLEKRLQPLGYKVEWLDFAAGPQQLEALNANGLDIASTAESPPVFSQAAGVPLIYLAALPSSGKSISLLVPPNSPVKKFADLKGKKVAFQKASIGHYLLVKALEKEGLKLTDVQSVFLAPSDANAALSQGKVDAWFIWEPFVTRNEQKKIGRVLIDGGELRDTNGFFSTNRKFYEGNREAIKIFFEEVDKADKWVEKNPKQAAELLAPVTQLDAPTLEKMHAKYEWGLRPITEQTINKQQEVADKWFSLGQIPKKVNVKDGFLTPEQYAEITPLEVQAKK